MILYEKTAGFLKMPDFLATKWGLPILWEIHKGNNRSGSIRRTLGAHSSVFFDTLQRLVKKGVIKKTVITDLNTHYEIVDKDLIPLLEALNKYKEC